MITSPTADDSETLHAPLALRHPLFLAALAILLLNDHVLKRSGVLPAALTGKASDFAGMLVAPLVLFALTRSRRVSALALCHAVVGAAFAAVKLSPSAANALAALVSEAGVPWRIWSDPTDLVALPLLLVSFAVFSRIMQRERPRAKGTLERFAGAAGAIACIATSYMPPPNPVRGPGAIYTNLGGCAVLDEVSGKVLRPACLPNSYRAAPVIAQGIAYGAPNQRLVALDLATGKPVFEHGGPEERFYGVALDGGRVFAERVRTKPESRALVAFDAKTGVKVWEAALAAEDLDRAWRPFVAGDVVVSFDGKRFAGHAKVDGKLLFSQPAEATTFEVVTTPTTFYYRDKSGIVHGRDAKSGAEVLRFDAKLAGPWQDHEQSLGVADDTFFAVAESGVHAFDTTTHAARFTMKHGKALVAGGSTVATYEAGRVVVADAKTGQVRFEIEGQLTFRVALGDGSLLLATVETPVLPFPFSTGTDALYAFDLATGKLLWERNLSDPKQAAPDAKKFVVKVAPSK